MVAMNVWPTDAADGSVSSEARWRKMARLWTPSGVAAGIGAEMAPTLAYPNLTVKNGAVWADGHYCELLGDQVLAVTANGLAVVRFDPAANTAELLYRDGVTVPAQNPTGTWEVPIAKIVGSALFDQRAIFNPTGSGRMFLKLKRSGPVGAATGTNPLGYNNIVSKIGPWPTITIPTDAVLVPVAGLWAVTSSIFLAASGTLSANITALAAFFVTSDNDISLSTGFGLGGNGDGIGGLTHVAYFAVASGVTPYVYINVAGLTLNQAVLTLELLRPF